MNGQRRADFSQPAVADEKENEDAEDQVMNVPPAGLNEMKGRNLVLDGIDHGPDSGEGEKETDRSSKQPPPRTVGNAFVENIDQKTFPAAATTRRPCPRW